MNIGTEIIKALMEQAQIMELKILVLFVFATNKRAIHLYEKVGFAQTGRIPEKFFKDGNYIDEIVMTKILE